MTGYESVMAAALAALESSSPALNVRRAHRTAIPRSEGDTIHLVDGDDSRGNGGGAKCGKRRMTFTTSIFVRSDAGAGAADQYRIAIVAAFDGATWPTGVVIEPPGTISVETEIADEDATRIDMEWAATYPTASEWSLELP